jgi:hypothetical protein
MEYSKELLDSQLGAAFEKFITQEWRYATTVVVEIRAIPDTVNELPTRIMHILCFILHRGCIHQHVTHT